MQAHGGEIWIDTEQGQGTTFRMLFPAAPPPDPTRDLARPPVATLKRARVLLVDDEDSIRHVMRGTLPHHGLAVETCADGDSALERLRSTPAVDVLVTDLTMPTMSGLELAAQARELQPDLPILLCTGFTDEETEARALRHGVRGILHKPLSAERLARRIVEVLPDSTSDVAR